MADSSRFQAFADHPQTNLVAGLIMGGGAVIAPDVLAYVLWAIAAVLIVRALWRWKAFRERIPFDFQTPIVRRNAKPKVIREPAAMGTLDFALYMNRATVDMGKVLESIGAVMMKYGKELDREAAKLGRLADADLETRHKAITRAVRPINKESQDLERLEADYRRHVEAMAGNGRQWVAGALASGEDLSPLVESVVGMKAAAEGGRTGTISFRDSAQNNRDMNISQATNSASERLVSVLDRVVEDTDDIIAYCDWLIATAGSQ